MTRKRFVLGMVVALLWVFTLMTSNVHAQTETFLIRSPSSQLSSDGEIIIVEFDVINNSSSDSPASVVRLFDNRGIELNSQALPTLAVGARQTITLTAPVSAFAPGSYPSLYITAGLDALPGGSHIGRGDIASISVVIPTLPDTEPGVGGGGETTGTRRPFGLPFDLPFSIDLNNPLQVVLAVAIGGLCLIFLWVLVLIIRLITVRPEVFGTWQPAYPPPPVIDPNTTGGRRYLWQQHAQSDALVLPCNPGSIMARKHVTGAKGDKFDGWHVVALRTGRYDQYGRIGRTHHTVSTGVIRRLDRLARRRKMSEQSAARAVRPVAKALVKHVLKTSDKRSSMLPIALDIRLKGKGSAPHVAFELFRCEANGWAVMDSWLAQPTVSANGGVVEQFGYSFYGQRHDEPKKIFQKRLEQDLTRVLANLVYKPERPKLEDTAGHPPVAADSPPTVPLAPVEPPAQAPPTEPSQQPVEEDK